MKQLTSIHEFGPFLKKEKLLYAAAEIGVAEGRFSLEMMNWGFKKIYLVDIWEHRPDLPGDSSSPQEWHDLNLRGCEQKLKKFGKKVVYLKGESKNMVHKVKDDSLGFLYMDGNHEYQAVLDDLNIWLPKMTSGAIIAGHDYNDIYGVKQAVNEFTKGKAKKLPELAEENAGFWFYVDFI